MGREISYHGEVPWQGNCGSRSERQIRGTEFEFYFSVESSLVKYYFSPMTIMQYLKKLKCRTFGYINSGNRNTVHPFNRHLKTGLLNYRIILSLDFYYSNDKKSP